MCSFAPSPWLCPKQQPAPFLLQSPSKSPPAAPHVCRIAEGWGGGKWRNATSSSFSFLVATEGTRTMQVCQDESLDWSADPSGYKLKPLADTGFLIRISALNTETLWCTSGVSQGKSSAWGNNTYLLHLKHPSPLSKWDLPCLVHVISHSQHYSTGMGAQRCWGMSILRDCHNSARPLEITLVWTEAEILIARTPFQPSLVEFWGNRSLSVPWCPPLILQTKVITQAELHLVAVGIPAQLHGEVPDSFSVT